MTLDMTANFRPLGNSFAGLPMPLSWRDKLAMLMPPPLFYRRRIAQAARTGEPELAILAKLLPRGGPAIDVGAHVVMFAYALEVCVTRRVVREPDLDHSLLAQVKLRGRADVHALAAR